MNISAVNCTPIKPQSFGNCESSINTKEALASNNQAIIGAQKALDLTKSYSDTYNPSSQQTENEDAVQKKNPLQIAISVAGAFCAMFLLGRSSAQLAMSVVKKIPQAAKEKLSGFVSSKAPKINIPKPSINNEKFSKVVNAATKHVSSFAQKCKANPENVAGAIATLSLAPALVKVDGNNDGVADIAQKNVNAYSSFVKSAGVFSEIIDLLS